MLFIFLNFRSDCEYDLWLLSSMLSFFSKFVDSTLLPPLMIVASLSLLSTTISFSDILSFRDSLVSSMELSSNGTYSLSSIKSI
ncbi:hypothetical protein L1987_62240 [Smallanthus sonchifolius]|uniref:Uncharacterized protein n=1 Tax=Smallanthus sonchifolius TaxID=185202 RepID=A0ACB9C9U1_9ASTR|nr:hypothetical protein L1987_62240 [Smallanthus sonchifolius]